REKMLKHEQPSFAWPLRRGGLSGLTDLEWPYCPGFNSHSSHRRVLTSAVARSPPAALEDKELRGLGCCRGGRDLPVGGAQSVGTWGDAPPLATSLPSGMTATHVTPFDPDGCPAIAVRTLRPTTSQMRTAPSVPPETSVLPSAVKASA